MAKKANETPSATLRLTLSRQSLDLLNQLAGRGIHGKNAAEVAARMVDRALEAYVEAPRLTLLEDTDGD